MSPDDLARMAAHISAHRQSAANKQPPQDTRTIEEIFASIMSIWDRKAAGNGVAPLPPEIPIPPRPPRFNHKDIHPAVEHAWSTLEHWVIDIKSNADTPYWLYLYGGSGCGKSHLQSVAHYTLRRAGFRSVYKKWPLLIEDLLNDDSLIYRIIKTPVLILDDIGAEYIGSEKKAQLVASKLYIICEERMNRWTFFTSNLSPKHVAENLDIRIASRLHRGQNLILDLSEVPDYSLTHKST